MKAQRSIRRGVLASILFACTGIAYANDTIRMSWTEEKNYMYSKSFYIKATIGEQFMINWGNGDIDTVTGTGSWQQFSKIYSNYYKSYTITIIGLTEDCYLTNVNCQNMKITDLSINCVAFPNLDCSGYQLTGLDVSKCLSLDTLNCSNNQLTNLDARGVTHLNCSNNQLTNLDASDVIHLNCSYNQLTNLDLKKYPSIEYLNCTNNQLSFLDVNNNLSLCTLNCSNNSLTELDVSNSMLLRYLNCCCNQLTDLDVSKSLRYLNCCCNQLTDLDVSKCIYLTELRCFNNQLTDLDVYNVTYLDCSFNQLVVLNVISVTKLYCSNNQLTNLDISKCPYLEELDCSHNQLTDLDVSKCRYSLDCSHNQLTILDVNNSLKTLNCSYNQLTTLDTKSNLSNLDCSHNQLTTLDVNNSLTTLNCSYNQLTTLDVGGGQYLWELNCSHNQLTTALDVSQSTFLLRLLDCSNNRLNSLILNEKNKIFDFDCSDNRFQLSDLYNLSILIHSIGRKKFGTQRLDSQEVKIEQLVDYSAQKEFAGTSTVFTIEKNSMPALLNDYTEKSGQIIFKDTGYYTITMTNTAIIYPTQVIASINVTSNVGIAETAEENFKIYPNPTNSKLQVTSYEFPIKQIEIFDIYGRKVETWHAASLQDSTINIDVSHLVSGIYFLKVNNKITKKIIKY